MTTINQQRIQQSDTAGIAKTINAGVIGATGYAGQELVRLLAQHPGVNLKAVTSQTYNGENLSDVFPNLKGKVDIVCSDGDIGSLAASCDVVFIALPHGFASKLVTSEIIAKTKVIDLGADFRLSTASTYEHWYQTKHESSQLLADATYGLPEWNESQIRTSRLIANPGCYATVAALTLLPLVQAGVIDLDSIIIDAKSGVSGAGRAATQGVHFNECNETLKAYSLTTHKHTPEIEEQLGKYSSKPVNITFTPHLVPMNRGILATVYASLAKNVSKKEIHSIYKNCYDESPFIRIYEPEKATSALPETRWVKGSNYCDIGYAVQENTSRVIVIGALDNLVKGAAGQAIQNMNIMFSLDQRCGLDYIPMFPA